MRFIRKFTLVICACLFVLHSFAAETARVSCGMNDGSVQEALMELTPRKIKGSYRLKIKKNQLPPNVKYVDVVFDFAKAKKGQKGYFILGDGRMGAFRADNGFLRERRNVMPIFGMKTPSATFVAIVKKLKYEYSTHVDVIDGEYSVYPRFHLSKEEMGFAPYEDILIDVYFFDDPNAGYSEMGRTYRKYQLDRGEVKPLSERAKNNPQLAYTADTIFVRVKHGAKINRNGIADQTPENEPKVSVNINFDRFKEIMRKLKSSGVEKAEICSVGSNSGGFDGRFPDIFPIEPAFGGENKFKEAIDYAHSIGYQIVVHVCNTDFYSIAKRFNKDDVARKTDGKLRTGGILAGGRVYNPCFKQVYEKYIEDDYKRLSALGLKGTHHIDVTSCIVPYLCTHPGHPCNRKQTAEYMNKIGFAARKYFGGFGSEGPCDHVASSLDYALYASAYPNWVGGKHPLVDKVAPLWQIVYHGIIVSNPFYYTIDYNIDAPRWFSPYNYVMDPVQRRLKLYEYGGRPTFYFIGYSDDQIIKIREAYEEYQPMKYLQYMFMDYHGEIAPDVFLTRYSDGSEVVTNYTGENFLYKGQNVSALDYKLFKHEN